MFMNIDHKVELNEVTNILDKLMHKHIYQLENKGQIIIRILDENITKIKWYCPTNISIDTNVNTLTQEIELRLNQRIDGIHSPKNYYIVVNTFPKKHFHLGKFTDFR